MAFNLMVVADGPLDWSTVHEQYSYTDNMFEVCPILDAEGGDAVGISIPMKYFNQHTWTSASRFLKALADQFDLKLYDMYAGQQVDLATYVPDGMDAG